MQVDILYFKGCPNHGPTRELVHQVGRDLGIHVSLREVEVADLAAATRLRFLGSPTVQVDGMDIEPAARERTDFSFSCRIYGRSGTPPRLLVETALRERLKT